MTAPKRRNINIIVAVTADNAIGRNGDLVCRLSPDMRHFRQLTTGHTVIMGRRTWQSLPNGALPDRNNIVLSTDPRFNAPGAQTFISLDDALKAVSADEQVFIIGGAQVYSTALPIAERIYLTQIDIAAPDADTYFPDFDPERWEETLGTETTDWQTDPKTGIRYRFVCLSRK